MRVLVFLLKYSWGLLLLAIGASIVAGLSNVLLVALINVTLTSRRINFAHVLWTFVGLILIVAGARALASIILTRLAQNATLELRMRLAKKILATPARQLEKIGGPRLLATLTTDISTLTNGLLSIATVCLQSTLLIGCLGYLAWLSGTVFLGVFVFIVLAMSVYQLGVKLSWRFLKLAREQHDSLFKHFRSLTEGTKELKLHKPRREAFLSRVLLPTSSSLRRHQLIGSGIFTATGAWGQLMFFVLIGLVIFGLPLLPFSDPLLIIGYVFIILYITVILEVLSAMLPNLSSAAVALQKIQSLGISLTAAPASELPFDSSAFGDSCETLELVGVTHSYHREGEDSTLVLGLLSLSFRSPSLVFVTGGNGSGKTSLVKLLTGLYQPEQGEVKLNGIPVTAENRESYLQFFSAVFSDFYLFEALLGLEQPKLDIQARDYLAELQLERQVSIEDGRLSTTELSQGQRKRLALLTAYLEDRPIYVFDEWAADQDPLFKEVFYRQILPALKKRGKLCFVISHDDRYYDLADHVVKLENGSQVPAPPPWRPPRLDALQPESDNVLAFKDAND
jgi:putative pyoverdin transport system ATP-binding/permease protein